MYQYSLTYFLRLFNICLDQVRASQYVLLALKAV